MTLPNFTSLLSQSIGTYKKYWRSFGMIALLFSAIPGLALNLAIYSADGNTNDLTTFSALVGILTFLVTIIGVMGTLATIYLVHHRETNNDWYAAAKIGVNRFFPYLGVVIPTAIVTFAGLILLVIPGIIVGVYLMFVSYVFIAEDKRGLDALRRSRDLVRGHFWQVFGRTLLLGLLFAVIAISVSLIQVVGPVIVSLILPPISTIYFYYLYKSLSSAVQ